MLYTMGAPDVFVTLPSKVMLFWVHQLRNIVVAMPVRHKDLINFSICFFIMVHNLRR